MRRATYLSVAVGSLLIVVKLVAWGATDSVALLSTLIDSTLDTVASLVNLFAVRQALQPADHQHRFGHGKAEPLAGLAQSTFIAGSALFLVGEAGKRMFFPEAVDHAPLGIAVMAFSIVMTVGLVLFQRYVIRRTGSLAIDADHLHYVGDLGMNMCVIVSLILSAQFGFEWADPLFALGIAGFLVYSAATIAWRSLHLLMDREFPDEDRKRIAEICQAHPDVHDIHDLRTRSAGLQGFIQLHLELDPDISLKRAHVISDEVEAGLRKAFPAADVIIHQDPAGTMERKDPFDGERYATRDASRTVPRRSRAS
ncbi:divalent metal cation transporter FieF [Telmatospirillum siberiense]|uniref:Cation-efflux pump FieF n=2 Tax=Telmatospirillum siberiense TaxID=382514 RepID=A0A2N3Q0S7_9PROT|nr:divalent metal cation transporter FieF [Telmatospirillum siberiense]